MSCADSDEQRKQNTERYRSGHNEAVLKTVCPQGHMGSNPIVSVFYSLAVCGGFLFLTNKYIYFWKNGILGLYFLFHAAEYARG